MEWEDSKKEFLSLEFRIENFRTNSEKTIASSNEILKSHDFLISLYLVVNFKGVEYSKGTKDWLIVLPIVNVHKGFITLHHTILSWIVSIIDADGNSRFPQSFELHYDGGIKVGGLLYEQNLKKATYLEKSFIFSRADELLPNGDLTLRCDAFFSWHGVSPSYPLGICSILKNTPTSPFEEFFRVIPQRVCYRNDSETENPGEPFTEFDLTSRAITYPDFHAIFMDSGCSGMYDEVFSLISKEYDTDISKQVWTFDVQPDRYLISLDGQRDTVGARLLKASSLVRRCVEAPMRERREKRIEFSDVGSKTFQAVLFFLTSGTLPNFEFDTLVCVYKFSHLFEMEELQRMCAKCMVESVEPERSVLEKELERIADLYSDEYLSELLESQRLENFKRDLKPLRMDDRVYSNCYI